MKFGVREISDVVFKALQTTKVGSKIVNAGEPVLFIDSAKTSTIEGAATTVYAQGGRGNSRLIAWEGEKTLTFTVEDALLSEVGFALLAGAGLFDELGKANADANKNEQAMVHKVGQFVVNATGQIIIKEKIATNAPIFIMSMNKGSVTGLITNATSSYDETKKQTSLTINASYAGSTVFVDYYIGKQSVVTEIQIDAENFAGYYYVEGITAFRRESDGKDLKTTLTFPKVKIQSNFTFSMSASGDPSTFTFTMDAMPGYTMFNPTKKVLLVMQITNEEIGEGARKPVTTLDGDSVDADIIKNDSLLDWTSEEYFDFTEVNENNEEVVDNG